eukprot:3199558-Alexandrium_andersonii.AAC.1
MGPLLLWADLLKGLLPLLPHGLPSTSDLVHGWEQALKDHLLLRRWISPVTLGCWGHRSRRWCRSSAG